MQHCLRERVLELVQVNFSVAAFPGVQDLYVRPIMLRQDSTVFFFQCPELGSPFRIRLHAGLEFLPDFRFEIYLVRNGTMLDVIDIIIIELVHIVLELYDGGRVGCDDQSDIILHAHPHKDIVARVVVGYRIDALRVGVQLLHESRSVPLRNA